MFNSDSIVSLANPVYRRRQRMNKIMLMLSLGALLFGLFWLFWIIGTLIFKGGSSLSINLFFEATPPPGGMGGLMNAIVGSVMMAAVGTLIGTPIGILAGTYVAQVGHYSGWAGSVALAILVIPVVVRSTDNMLSLVPNSLREAAAALGCPQWKIIFSICYRAARSGIVTGILLAVARISGETAPLLFTALNNQFMSWNMNAPMANLPVVIFQFAASPFSDWNDLAWAGAVLITLFVLGINILARALFRK